MNKTFNELVELVNQWAKEKGIHEKSNALHQLHKTKEEVQEFLYHTAYQEIELQDDLGDIVVTLINYCHFRDINITKIYEEINQPIKHHRFIKIYLDKLMKSALEILLYSEDYRNEKSILSNNVSNLLQIVLEGCHFINKPLEECLGSAYEVISKRKGHMHNGIFIKEN